MFCKFCNGRLTISIIGSPVHVSYNEMLACTDLQEVLHYENG